jgi:hypothetical protein
MPCLMAKSEKCVDRLYKEHGEARWLWAVALVGEHLSLPHSSSEQWSCLVIGRGKTALQATI